MDVDALQPADLNGKIQGDFDNGKANQGLGLEEPNKIGLVDGLNGTKNGPSVVEADPVPDGNFPKDAVDEWPAPKQIHSFYIVRFRSYEDPQLRDKIKQADKELQKKNQARFQLTEAIKAKKSDRAEIISQLKPLTAEDKRYRMIVGEKRKDMEPLQVALGKMRTAKNAVREKGAGLCSSEEELNEIIQSLHYRMQHESNTLAVEKQLLKEIKQLEGTREKVIANAAMKAKLQDTFGQSEAIQDELKHIGGDLDGVRREQLTVKTKIRQLEEQLKAIEAEINELQLQLTAENEKRNIAYESLIALRKKREEGNACYYENRSLLNMAKEHAAKKDVTALDELSHLEVEKFMSLWSRDKAFRDDYERRILPSLDSRQLSRDGRMRNPDEKPLAYQLSTTVESQTVPLQANTKKTKEDATPRLEQDTAHKEGTNKLKEAEKKEKLDEAGDASDYVVPEKVQKEPAVTNLIDAAKLREIKREEEIAKAKSALERKKRLAEKAAAKAAIRAQKEAEKKLKDREKKAKKKAGSSDPGIEAEVVEPEDAEVFESEKAEAVDEAPVTKKVKEQRVNIRQRNRPRAQDALPKVIHRRKKSPSYWVWAIPAASLLVVILAGLAYYYFL